MAAAIAFPPEVLEIEMARIVSRHIRLFSTVMVAALAVGI
jgi:hypothetical protein